MELWPLLYLVDRKSFPSANKFQDMYLNSWGGFRTGGEKKLLEKLGLQYLARDRKSAGVTIPPQTIQEHNIEFDVQKYARQARAYDEIKNQAILYNSAGDKRMNMAAAITQILRLRQAITYPMGIKSTNEHGEIVFQCDIDESQKLDYAVDLIHELVEEGERVVLFSQFKAPLHELRRRLQKKSISLPDNQTRSIRPCVLDGGTSDYMKDIIRHDFDIKTASAEHYQYDVVLANYKVGGQSINLTAASQMVILDEQWNPGMEDQAFGRIDRLDTPKETTVHILRVMNSIDEWMAALKDRKAQMIEGFETNADMVREFLTALHEGTL
jgi:SNF2 family DNA or RNA helicase